MTRTSNSSDATAPRASAMRKWQGCNRLCIQPLTDAEMEALKAGSQTYVYFAGATEIVPGFLGDTDGVVPFFIGRGQSWFDTVTSTLDRYSPTYAQALWFRRWLPSPEAAELVEAELMQELPTRADWLRGRAFDLRRDVSMSELKITVKYVAISLGLEVLNDDELIERLQSKIATAA